MTIFPDEALGAHGKASPKRELDTFPNPEIGRDYSIRMRIPEFTCVCPKTGQPDFATLHLEYVPDKLCIELKSLKLFSVIFCLPLVPTPKFRKFKLPSSCRIML